MQQRRQKQANLNNISHKDAAIDASDDIEHGSNDNVVVNDRVDGLSDYAEQVLTPFDVCIQNKQVMNLSDQTETCGEIRVTRSKKGINVGDERAIKHMTTTHNGDDSEHIPDHVKLKPAAFPSTLVMDASVNLAQCATWPSSKKDVGQIFKKKKEPLPSTSGTANVVRKPAKNPSYMGGKQKQKNSPPMSNSGFDPPVGKKPSRRGARSEVLKLQKALASASWTDSKAVERQEHAIDLETQYDSISPEQNHQVILRRLELRVPAYRRWQNDAHRTISLALAESKAEMSTNEKAKHTKVMKVKLNVDQSPTKMEDMEYNDKDEHIRKKKKSSKVAAMKHGSVTDDEAEHDEVAVEYVGANELAEGGLLDEAEDDIVAADGLVEDDDSAMMINSERAELDGVGEVDKDPQAADKAHIIGTVQDGSALCKSQMENPLEQRAKRKRTSTTGNATALDREPVLVVPRRTSHGPPRDGRKLGRSGNALSLRRGDEPRPRADIEGFWQPQRHGKWRRASRQLEAKPEMRIRFDLSGEGVEVEKGYGVEEENMQGVAAGFEEGEEHIEEALNADAENIAEENSDEDDEDYDAAQDGFLVNADVRKSWKGRGRDKESQPGEMRAVSAGKSVKAATSRRCATAGVVVETKVGTRRRTRSGVGQLKKVLNGGKQCLRGR